MEETYILGLLPVEAYLLHMCMEGTLYAPVDIFLYLEAIMCLHPLFIFFFRICMKGIFFCCADSGINLFHAHMEETH